MEHEEIEQAFRDYFGKDWEIELRDFKHGGFGWYDAIRAERSVKPMVIPPDGYRLLKRGEIIMEGDIYMIGLHHWQTTNRTGAKWNPNGLWPMARKVN